ncbi:MAG: transcription termination factor Rho [Gemmatimonadota bacterium]
MRTEQVSPEVTAAAALRNGYLGVLEKLGNGAGFIRRPHAGYVPSDDDIYVGQKLIDEFRLRTGDEIWGETGSPPSPGKSPPLTRVTKVNERSPEAVGPRPEFTRLSALHPNRPLKLECGLTRRGQPDHTNRVIDLLCPFGLGQRALIVAPAKAGKTMVLQSIGHGIAKNYPEMRLLTLLVDERPEEVTEMEACGFGEVVASSFDFPAERHVAVAEITLERARRWAEMGEHVVLILDSITRLARAYNNVEEGSGRTLTGGIDAASLEKPKRFFGSARNIPEKEGGGSLTIIATALIDTGSRMDQVIFEEFKGTGNSELVLSRELAERRVFPAIDLSASATRREELLLSEQALSVAHAMRRELADRSPVEAMTEVLALIKKAATNDALIEGLFARL